MLTIYSNKAYEKENSAFNGITDFGGLVPYPPNNPTTWGHYRIFGPDMQVKAIKGNTGAFKGPHPLRSLLPFIPFTVAGYTINNQKQ